MRDLSALTVARELPPAGHYTDRAHPLFQRLCGATILEMGTPVEDDPRIEGGGLIIDYMRAGETTPQRVVFGFNEAGMWVEFEGPLTPSNPA